MIGFKEVAEIAAKRFAEGSLGKMAEGKVFDKPMSEYDKPMHLSSNEVRGEKADDNGKIYTDESGRITSSESVTEKTPENTRDTDAQATVAGDISEKNGGAYKDLPSKPGHERHHIPAYSTSDLSKGEGPSIVMEIEDHKQTASYDHKPGAKEYREQQRKLIKEGKFEEAQQMDIDDIRSKFGDKYDKAIEEAKDYTKKIIDEGKVNA